MVLTSRPKWLRRHRVSLQRDTATTPDAAGHVTPAWVEYESVWASITPTTGREYQSSNQIVGDVTHQIRFVHSPEFTPRITDRVVFDGRSFNVLSAENVGEVNREWLLLTKEVA